MCKGPGTWISLLENRVRSNTTETSPTAELFPGETLTQRTPEPGGRGKRPQGTREREEVALAGSVFCRKLVSVLVEKGGSCREQGSASAQVYSGIAHPQEGSHARCMHEQLSCGRLGSQSPWGTHGRQCGTHLRVVPSKRKNLGSFPPIYSHPVSKLPLQQSHGYLLWRVWEW